MKIPSFTTLLQQIRDVVARFSVQCIIALAAVVVAVLLADAKPGEEDVLVRILCFCMLGLTSSLAAYLYATAVRLGVVYRWLWQVLALLISAAIMLWLRPHFWEKDIFILLFFVIAFHLMVAYSAFIENKTVIAFWHFNKILFLRFLTAGLYTAVITLGLFAALAAVDNLFDVVIQSSTYLKVLAVTGIGFNTFFFLSGIPEVKAFTYENVYPRGLKIFTQYVLIPLMTVYLVILFLYEIKIAVQWQLPKGYVSFLILGYAVFGILSLLLVYPIKDREENKWIKWFSKFFYVMMVPLLLLLAMAIYKRISDYGITEERYILIVLAVWLAGITVYFLWSTKQNIKVIPISLSVLCLVSAIGPQSAASVSKNSQVNRLKHLIQQSPTNNSAGIASIIHYLIRNHGLVALQPLVKENLNAIQAPILYKAKANEMYTVRNMLIDTVYNLLQLQSIKDKADIAVYKGFTIKNENALMVDGYKVIYRVKGFPSDTDTIQIGKDAIAISLSENHDVVITTGAENVRFNIDSICKNIVYNYTQQVGPTFQLADATLSSVKESKRMVIRLQLTNFEMSTTFDNPAYIANYSGYLLFKEK